MGLDDKTYLARTYGETLGKASITGSCLKFRRLDELNTDVLLRAIRDGMERNQPI